MNKRIVLSLGAIVFVAAAAFSATGAFFSDSEKSTGNTFTAGSLVLQVDSQSHYDGLVCTQEGVGAPFLWQQEPNAPTTVRPELIGQPCDGSWSQTTLGPANKFFNFTDIKPGDNGEDTISLHPTNNAWICANITTTANDENTYTQPEITAGDVSSTTGELAQNTYVFGWTDNASTSGATPGDNKWQAGETVLFAPTALSAIAGSGLTLPLADSTHGSPFLASSTGYVGVAWCVGTMNVSVPGTITCDGSSVGNEAQTDSATADITLTATQSRNNPNFVCGQTTEPNPNEINQNDLATSSADVIARPNSWFFYNDTNDTIMPIDQFSGTSGQNHMESVAGEAGAKMVLDTGANPRYNIATAQFGGTLLSAISSMKFRVYDATADSDTPFLQFNVDFATTTVALGYQGRLTMQPGSSTNAPLSPATWTTVDTLGTAMWTWSKFAVGPNLVVGGGDDNTWPDGNTNEYRTWNSILAAFPSAKLLTPGTFFGVRDGQPGPAGATDFVSSIEFNGTVYDFEL